jgi:hypothetical protein
MSIKVSNFNLNSRFPKDNILFGNSNMFKKTILKAAAIFKKEIF